MQKQVREFEPKIAVFSGHEGMDIYRRLIPAAQAALNAGGWFVTEIGYSEEEKVRELAGWLGGHSGNGGPAGNSARDRGKKNLVPD